MRGWTLLAICVLALAACSKPDPAVQARIACTKTGQSPAAQVAACTTLIESGDLNNEARAAALTARADAQARAGEVTAALRDYSGAILLDNGNMSAVRGRADILIKSGQFDAAAPLVERLISSGQFTAEAHFMQGKMAAMRSDFAAAITAFDAALADNPQYALALAERAKAKRAQGDPDGASADFDAAINMDPHLADARAGRCWLRLEKKPAPGGERDDGPAREDADAAVAADPRNFEGQLCLAMLQARAGDWSNARASFDVAANLQPGNPMALFGRGLARKRGGDGDGIKDMNQARDFNHDIDGQFIDLGVATY
jgi:tetratricopeptide (TPR) repeat protein